jgi:hypothetical protein
MGQLSKTLEKNHCVIFKILFLDGSQKEQFCSIGHKWVNTPKHKKRTIFFSFFWMAPKRSNFSFSFLGHKWINAPKQNKRTLEEELFPTNFHFSHELHDFESKHNFVR